jgi:hypothetical protein
MKAIMTAIALLGAGMLTTLMCPAQTGIAFTYDAGGNRETRTVIASRSAAVSNYYLLATPQSQPVHSRVGKQRVQIRFDAGKSLLRINFPWRLKHQEAVIEVADLNGKQIFHKISTSSKNRISISDYPSGYYRLTISVGEEKKEWEIIREQ